MSSTQDLLVVCLFISFLVSRILGNLFILIVHSQNWLKTHDFNPSILIINSIAFINIFFQGTLTFHRVTAFVFLKFYLQSLMVIPVVAILISLTFSSLWCSTCLCFYYCIKIVNFSSSFFYKIKAKIPVLVPWLLIIFIAKSWAIGLTAYWDLYMYINPMTDSTTNNETLIFSYSLNSRCKCIYQIYMLFAAVAFAIILVTAGSIVISLCKHMKRMKKNSEDSGNSRLHSHLSAAKTVTSLFLLYLIFYSSLISVFSEAENNDSFIFILSFVLASCFPTFNSIVLIIGNRKLSDSSKKLLGMRQHLTNAEVTVTAS
ncbi:taste receptor type 2 member 117-like [Engystomops pustulosus]